MSEKEVAERSLEQRVAGLEAKLDSMSKRHDAFETVHVSRRGVSGPQGLRGETGSVGPSANPQEVAKLAADIVQKMFRYDRQNEKFEAFMNELEGEIVRVKANLRFSIIEELKLGNILDEGGKAHPSLRGERGADSTTVGPRGDTGATGVGRNGADGKSVSKEEVAALIRQILDENPDKFRGHVGRDGASIQGTSGKDGMTEEDVLNLVIKAISDPSLLNHATVKLAHVEQWVSSVLARSVPNTPMHQAAESLREWMKSK
jgi:hypothetical protein